MSLLALDNILVANIMRQRFHADLRIRAVESLLFERIPLTLPAPNPVRSTPPLAKPGLDDNPAVLAPAGEQSLFSAVPRQTVSAVESV
jgi:hypothetical protein